MLPLFKRRVVSTLRTPEELAALVAPVEEPQPKAYSHDNIDYFWGYGLEDEEFDPEFVASQVELPGDAAWHERDRSWKEIEVSPREEFKVWEARKPIPPRSAVLAPPHLTHDEWELVRFLERVESLFDTPIKTKLKPELRKKLKLVKKGYQKIVFETEPKEPGFVFKLK